MTRLLPPILAAMLLVTGCTLLGPIDYKAYYLSRPEVSYWDVAGVNQVSAANVNANITVEVGTHDTVKVTVTRACSGRDSADAEANIGRIEVSIQVVDSVLTIETDVPDADPREFRDGIVLEIPQTMRTKAFSVNGQVDVTATDATLDLGTTNGSVATHGTRGNITAASTNGHVNIDMVELVAPHELKLSTANGHVTLDMPADASAVFTARTTNGVAEVTGFSNVTYTVNERNHKAGTIGTGIALITATSVNGDVTLGVR